MLRALDRKLARDLLRLKGPMAAIGLLALCGTAVFIALRGMHGNLVRSQQAYYARYAFADLFARLKQAPEALASDLAEIPGVSAVQTRVAFDVVLNVPGLDEPATGRLVSVPDGHPPVLNNVHLRRGRHVAPGRSEILASEAFATANGLGVGDSLEALINGRWRRLEIVGIALSPEFVYEIRSGGDIFPDSRRFGVLWMPHEALAAAFDMQGAFNEVALSLTPTAVEADVIARVDGLLARQGGLGAYGRRDHVSHRFITDEIEETRVTSVLIPTIFLGVTAIIIHMVLSRLVRAQREQIAVLKAFGYGNLAVGFHYLKLALAPVVVGTALGALLGLWLSRELAEIYALFYHFPSLDHRPQPVLIGAAVLIGCGAAAAGVTASVRQAIGLPPAEAMRPESPSLYRRGILERIGLGRRLSLEARMIFRQIERFPVKAALSALGVSLGVAIIVTARFGFDAIKHMKSIQFDSITREDVLVVFQTPLPGAVRNELVRLPGVLGVEPFRAVPVRLKSQHHARRSVLLGLEPHADLHRIVDRARRAHDIEPGRLLLTSALADILEVEPGDAVTVEVMEGARPVRELIVGGTADELIGLSAYMDRRRLNRLMREESAISGAYLLVDPSASVELYSRLKRLPAVGSVSVRAAALQGFEETIAVSFLYSIIVVIAFACLIAFGVVRRDPDRALGALA